MFRKLDVAKLEQTKSSVARGIRGRIAEQYPQLEDEEVLDELIPKKCVICLLYTSPSPRDYAASRMPSSA